MAHWSESAVTDVGVTMLNEYMAGRQLTITAAYGGSGIVDEDKLVEQTDLLEQRQTLHIVEVADAPSGKTLTIQVHNVGLAEAYSLSQIGVYAKLDGEHEPERLLFITQDRSPVLVPPESEELFVFDLFYNVGITNTGRFHVTIDAAGVATIGRLKEEINRVTASVLANDVSTPLETASGEPVVTRRGEEVRAHRKNACDGGCNDYTDMSVTAVASTITRMVEYNVFNLQNAIDALSSEIVAGDISAPFETSSGARITTRDSNEIRAHRKLTCDGGSNGYVDMSVAAAVSTITRMVEATLRSSYIGVR